MSEDHSQTDTFEQQFAQDIVVLLVDDQMIIGEAVRRMLAPHEDISFHYCQNPQEALARAAEVGATVILQDLVMPEINGLDLVPQYRQQAATKDTPLIVLSTKEEAETKARAFALGANDYLVKLPDQLELVARIRYHSKGYISLLQRNAAYEMLARSRQQLAEQMEAGAKYMLALLPDPVDSPIQVTWRYIPSADLGGDTFGYHWIDEDHFAIYLVDVTGHGLDSALLSVTIMNVLRSRSLGNVNFCKPDEVMGALNDAFRMEQYGDKLFTMWYGVYQRSSSTLCWSGGGHPDALLFEGDGKQPVTLESQGPMMGMMDWPEFETGRHQVQSPARLYVYSDGVHEIQKVDGEEWTFQEYIDFLSSLPADPVGTVMDRLLAHVQQLGGSEQLVDDFSIIEARF